MSEPRTRTKYTYDSLSRLTGKAYSNTSLMPNVCTTVPNNTAANVCNNYDAGGAGAFALGRLTSVADPSGSETFIYDAVGRVTQKLKAIGNTTYPILYQYNAGGQLTQITYPSGRVVHQNVDNVGLLNTIISGGTTYASIPEPPTGYNAAGQLLTFTYPNGVAASFGYSSTRQQMTSLSYVKGSVTLFSLNYYYQQDSTYCMSGTPGNDGQIECIADNTGSATQGSSGRSVSYTYDALGRINTALTTGSSQFGQWGLAWVYDRYGNRVSQNQTAGSPPMNSLSFATTPAPPANPPGGAFTNRPDGYFFDASGNMLNDGQNTLSYDAENCLISSANSSTGTSTYTCDSKAMRVKKVLQGSTTTAYVFSGGKDIAEYDNGAAVSSPSREYIYLGGRLISTIQGTTTLYHHADHLSVRLTTDVNGAYAGEQGHYPYGEQWYAHNTTTKFFFTSYERDASDSGNDYAMARFYINRFGRFSCVDPLLGQPGDPQTWNRYAYVRNNPTNNVDPTGMGWLVNFFKVLLDILTLGAGYHFQFPTTGTPPIFSDPLGNTQATLNSIYNPIDPSKFGITDWSPAAHDQMMLHALGPCDVPRDQIQEIQQASRNFDATHQGHEWSFAHSMSDGTVGETAEHAVAQRNQFVNDNLMAAQRAYQAGDINGAMNSFGVAMHPVMDYTSPAHTDAQNNPIPWCGYGGCGTWPTGEGQVLQHSAKNVTGETTGLLNAHPEYQRTANSLIRIAYEIMSGRSLDCGPGGL